MASRGLGLLSLLVSAIVVAGQPPFPLPPGHGPPGGFGTPPPLPFGSGPQRPRPTPPFGSGTQGSSPFPPFGSGTQGSSPFPPFGSGTQGSSPFPQFGNGTQGGLPFPPFGSRPRPGRPLPPQFPAFNQTATVIPPEELANRALAQATNSSTCIPGINSCSGNICGKNLSSVFRMVEEGEWRILITNGIPNHTYAVGDQRPNPNSVCVHNSYMKVPRNPTLGSFQPSGMGPVGIALSGGFFYNHLSTPKGDVAKEVEGPSFDSCSGHADPQCRYHYHMVPKCLDPDNTCKLVGYMIDGFPVYSYCTVNGQQLRSCYKKVSGDGTNQSHYEYSPDSECQLDEANGYDFGGTQGYGYVFSENYPFIMRGFKGSKVYNICSVV